MGTLVEFQTESGASVLVEVSEQPGSVVTRGSSHSGIAERAQQTFEEALGRVRPAVEGVIAQLRSLADRPDEVSVEFGIDLHAEAGAFVAAAGSTANFKVSLTWHDAPDVIADAPHLRGREPTKPKPPGAT